MQSDNHQQGACASGNNLVKPAVLVRQEPGLRDRIHRSDGGDAECGPKDNPLLHELLAELADRGRGGRQVHPGADRGRDLPDSGGDKLPHSAGGTHRATQIQLFTYAKKYYSYTKYEASFCLYYSVFYIVSSCCVVYIVHGQNARDTKQLLLTDIHLVMLANAFT